ncbi:enoyl-CoA hydratase/isomerase family protein [Streptomyces sp. NPDC002928]|uniref:enoyl-CoA hydratase/isomerase family protein n=1 Tax=Streptomyces sp. NPDC002928 TaxID=3154440 RepID=UPI0033A0EB14
MTSTAVITVADLAAGAADADLLDADACPHRPLIVLDLDAGPTPSAAECEVAVRRARESDRLLVGRTSRSAPHCPPPLLDALDLTLVRAARDHLCTADAASTPTVLAAEDPLAEAETLRAHAEDQPHAALVLRQLLRLASRLPVEQALDAESFAYSTLLGGPGFARWLGARGERPQPPQAGDEPVLARRQGSTLRITLNRPERRNAHSARMRDALTAAVSTAIWDTGITEVVLDGNGPSFCSGGDLDEFGTAPDLATAHLIRTRAGAARQLHAIRGRLTSRLHGHCVGAGIELPAFGARVVAAPDTLIRLPELGMGLIPGAGGTVSIPRRIGRWRTLYLVLDGRVIQADRALAWGLVDQVEQS